MVLWTEKTKAPQKRGLLLFRSVAGENQLVISLKFLGKAQCWVDFCDAGDGTVVGTCRDTRVEIRTQPL